MMMTRMLQFLKGSHTQETSLLKPPPLIRSIAAAMSYSSGAKPLLHPKADASSSSSYDYLRNMQLHDVLNGSICLQDSQDKHQKAKLLESLCVENPKLSSLCGILFPNNSQSVWSGPHSLLHQRNSACASSIHAAIGTFME